MSLKHRDREFEAIVREHHSGLRFFIRLLGVNDAWVDDLAQETFLLAYRKWDHLDDPANALFWLKRIARNLVMNEMSKTSRRARLLDDKITDYLLTLPDDEVAPGNAEDKDLLLSVLRECLQRLPSKIRQMIDARYDEDQSAAVIGSKFSMNPTAVRKALFAARKKLSDCLGHQGVTGFNPSI